MNTFLPMKTPSPPLKVFENPFPQCLLWYCMWQQIWQELIDSFLTCEKIKRLVKSLGDAHCKGSTPADPCVWKAFSQPAVCEQWNGVINFMFCFPDNAVLVWNASFDNRWLAVLTFSAETRIPSQCVLLKHQRRMTQLFVSLRTTWAATDGRDLPFWLCFMKGGVLAPARKTSRSGNPWASVLASWLLVQVKV